MNGWNPKSCLWIPFRIDIPFQFGWILVRWFPCEPKLGLIYRHGHKMIFWKVVDFTPDIIPPNLALPSDGSRGHRDRFGRSALHLAALQGVVGLCRMLINHGAEVDCQVHGEQGGKRYLMSQLWRFVFVWSFAGFWELELFGNMFWDSDVFSHFWVSEQFLKCGL